MTNTRGFYASDVCKSRQINANLFVTLLIPSNSGQHAQVGKLLMHFREKATSAIVGLWATDSLDSVSSIQVL